MLEEHIVSLWHHLCRQHEESLWKRSEDKFLCLLTRLPAFPSWGRDFVSERLFSPFLFLFAFIIFLGLSDHALSCTGLLGVILGLVFFFCGMKAKRITLPSVSQKFFYPLLLACLLSFLLLLYDWSTFQLFTYIPLLLLLMTGKYTKQIALLLLLFWGFIFKIGWWAVSAPYLFIACFYLVRYLSSGFFQRNVSSLFFLLFTAGTFFFFSDIGLVLLQTGKLPLLSEGSRGVLDPTFTMISHLLPLSCILLATMRKRSATLLLFLFSIFAMTVLGFRTQVVFLFFAVAIAASQSRIMTKAETYASLLLSALVGLALTGIRNLILKTNISLLDAIRLRVGLTLDIYDMMASLGGATGYTKGQVYISAIPGFARLMPNIAWAPRRMIAEFVGMKGSATSTILGPVAVDFGLLGIALFMFFLGYLLAKLFQLSQRGGIYTVLYASCLAYSLIGIETGIVDLEVLGLFLFSFFFIRLDSR